MSFDKRITITLEQLQSIGVLDAPQAIKNMDLLQAELGPDGFHGLLQAMLSELSMAADPDLALNNLERFAGSLRDVSNFVSLCLLRHDILRSLLTIFGASRFLSTFLVTAAEENLVSLGVSDYLDHSAGQEAMTRRLASLVAKERDDAGFYRALRVFRKQEMLRIGLRDLLAKADLQEIVGELSDLAEVCLQQAYDRADADLAKRYGRPVNERPDGTVDLAGRT